jgi:hypothetical protein
VQVSKAAKLKLKLYLLLYLLFQFFKLGIKKIREKMQFLALPVSQTIRANRLKFAQIMNRQTDLSPPICIRASGNFFSLLRKLLYS